MKNHRTSQSVRNENIRMPDSITSEFIQRIESLPRTSIKTDYLIEQYLSKFVSQDTDPPAVRRTRAINKWLATERNNEATNVRILTFHEEYQVLPRVGFRRFVDWTRALIETTIGAVPPLDTLIGSFSGGASTSRDRKTSYPAGKYLGKAHATPAAHALFLQLFEDEMPGWAGFRDHLVIEEVAGNVMFTVPKKADIDRCACKEPDINMFLQKGAGNHIRRSLRAVGINLNDQSINRSLARHGSITGELATLDLSSASDSVSSALVELLLPECWYTLLEALRSPITVIDSIEHQNEMFSSMGNGFTFELESLIFWALAKATAYHRGVSGVLSVYGDDLIVPVAMAQDLVWVLGLFGFEVNTDKSFWFGSFRESCGGHYYNGLDVTPFYLKAPIQELTDVMHIANSLRQWADFGEGFNILDPMVYDTWAWLRDMVPSKFWGGRDLSNKLRLVTPDSPRLTLRQRKRDIRTGPGGFIHWLNLAASRQTTPPRSHWSTGLQLNGFGSNCETKEHVASMKVALARTTDDCVETSTRSVDHPLYKVAKVREPVTSLQKQFPQEL